jgi:hypothetical protein
MKNATFAAVAFLIAVSAAAQVTLAEHVAQLREAQSNARATSEVHENVINLDGAASALLFPAAGSVAGSNGTFFRSDVSLVNYLSSDQNIHVFFLKQGIDNSSATSTSINLSANTPAVQRDFVGTTLGQSGLGAIVVFAMSGGAVTTSASMDGFSRIWTNQPGALGSVSQAFPPISIHDSIGSLTGYALGGRQDTDFRTNVGIVNLDTVAHTWTIDVNGVQKRQTFTIFVPAFSMNQQAIPAGVYGDLAVSMKSDGFAFWWSAYVTSVDNRTGDGWVSHVNQK